MPTLQRTDCRTISAGRIAWRTVLPCRNRRWTVRRIPVVGTTRAVRVRMRVHRHSVHRLGPPSHPQRSATADAYRNGVAAGCGIVWHRGVDSSWSRSALRADSLRVLFRTLTHLERWHGRRRHQTRVHSRIAAWLAWLAAIHHWIVRRVLHRRCHQLGIAGQQKGRPSWRHPLRAIHAARRMAWHFRRRTNRHTIPATHRTLRNASAYKTHIYKERP